MSFEGLLLRTSACDLILRDVGAVLFGLGDQIVDGFFRVGIGRTGCDQEE